MKIDNDVLAILSNSKIEGQSLYLSPQQLERKQYLAVNQILELMGGKWDRKSKSHIFSEEPSELLDTVILTGEITDTKKEFQFFRTPRAIVDQLIELADLSNDHKILEPSAGDGAISERIAEKYPRAELTGVELNPKLADVLEEKFIHYDLFDIDFLEYNPGPIFDRIVANPPFSKQQDTIHVLHMLDCLKPGGRLISIMSNGITFRQTNLTQSLRDYINEHGEIIPLPEGAFKESGTNVNACIVCIDKPSAGAA